MAGTQTKLTVVRDLCPKKPPTFLLDIGDTNVTAETVIETKGPPNSAQINRWQTIANASVEVYVKAVSGSVEDLTKQMMAINSKLRALKPGMTKELEVLKKQAQDHANTVRSSVQKACKSISGAVERDVMAQIKKEANNDANLLEAKVATIVKGGVAVLNVAKEIASLVLTAGANIQAWISLAKELAGLAKLVMDAMKDEQALRADFDKAAKVYIDTKAKRLKQAQAATDWKAKAKLKFKEVYKSQKSLADKAEAARKKYRNCITGMCQKANDLGKKADDMLTQVKAAKDLKQGVVLGGNLMELKRGVKALNADYFKCDAVVVEMGDLLTEAGVEVSDKTAMQRLSEFNTTQIKASASSINEAVGAIKKLVETLA